MNAPELDPITRAALEEQAQRLRETWTRTRDAVRAAPAGGSRWRVSTASSSDRRMRARA